MSVDTNTKLEELYLARKVTLETIRDCSMHSRARIDYAFILEIITLLYKEGLSVEEVIRHRRKCGDEGCAKSLELFVMHKISSNLRSSLLVQGYDIDRPPKSQEESQP